MQTCPATLRSASVVTDYLSDRPNWPTFPRGRTANRLLKPIRADQRTHRSFKQLRPGVLMLNIAAARVAPRRVGRQVEPRPATGGRSFAAIAERRRVEKSGFKPEDWHHSRHARSMPKQRERHAELWP